MAAGRDGDRAGFVAALVGVVVFHAAVGAVFFARVADPVRACRGWFVPVWSGLPGGDVATALFVGGAVVSVVALARPRRSLQAAACALLLLGSCMTCGVTGQGV